MNPTKSMMDYMSEMNRLFPKNENDTPQTPSPGDGNVSPLALSLAVQSSGSTDSASPESFPEMHRLTPSYARPIYDQSIYDTPIIVKKQRAIIGRKIMGNSEHLHQQQMFRAIPLPSPILLSENSSVQQTPPDTSKMLAENVAHTPNDFYELFPTGSASVELNSPMEMTFSSASCSSYSSSFSTNSTNSPRYVPHFSNPDLIMSVPSSSKYEGNLTKMCTFCRKNGETPYVYMTHHVKERIGNRSVVTCPILRSHVCSTCGSSGDNAHTITYCPVLRSTNNGQPLQSTTIMLKNTPVKSNGRRRYQH